MFLSKTELDISHRSEVWFTRMYVTSCFQFLSRMPDKLTKLNSVLPPEKLITEK